MPNLILRLWEYIPDRKSRMQRLKKASSIIVCGLLRKTRQMKRVGIMNICKFQAEEAMLQGIIVLNAGYLLIQYSR